MASIREIAAAAGVSVSTASKALNDREDVSEKTKINVKRIAQEMGYSPNPIAKRLSAKKKNLIGILILHTDILEIGGSIFMKILGDISRRAAREGYDILLMTPEEGRSYMEMARKRQIDGMVILGLTLDDPNLEEIRESTLPMTILDQYVEGKVCVTTDNRSAVGEIVKHLKDEGRSKIAFAGYCETSQAGMERYKGYSESMKERDERVYEGGFSYEEGIHMGREILKEGKYPDAVVCSADMAALGIIKTLRDGGIRVPEDIWVSGFDDLMPGRISTPSLTTVAQDSKEISRELLEGLIDMIEGKPAKDREIEGRLIIRESTGGKDEG